MALGCDRWRHPHSHILPWGHGLWLQHTTWFFRNLPQSIPTDHAEVIWDRMSSQSTLEDSLSPDSPSFHHMDNSQVGRNKLVAWVSFPTNTFTLVLMRALGTDSSLSQTCKALSSCHFLRCALKSQLLLPVGLSPRFQTSRLLVSRRPPTHSLELNILFWTSTCCLMHSLKNTWVFVSPILSDKYYLINSILSGVGLRITAWFTIFYQNYPKITLKS